MVKHACRFRSKSEKVGRSGAIVVGFWYFFVLFGFVLERFVYVDNAIIRVIIR